MIAFHALEFLKFHHIYLRGPVEIRDHKRIKVVLHDGLSPIDREVSPQEFADITGLQVKAEKIYRPRKAKVEKKDKKVYSFIH